MNICFVNPTRQVQSGLKGLVRALASKSHRAVVLTPTLPRQDELDALRPARVAVYSSLFIPKIRYTLPSFFSQLKILRDVVRKENIDIIYVYKYMYLTALVPVFYGRICGIPVIVITDSFAGISWKYGVRFVDMVARAYSESIGRLILRCCDKVIVLSSVLLEPCRNLGVKEPNLIVVPKGTDINRFALDGQPGQIRKFLGILPEEALILNVGRLVPVKGIDTLIKITEKLVHDGCKVRTVIVGDGPYRQEYEKMAGNLQGNIIFTGFRTDIPELISACDVFVLPSLSEGSPSALLEAGACGKPSVATNTGGIPDIIIHGETGFLVERGDIDSFVNYIKLLLNDKVLATRLGKKAYEHVKNNFNWDKVTESHEEICQQLIQNKKRKLK